MLKQQGNFNSNSKNSSLCCCGGSISPNDYVISMKPKTPSKISLSWSLKMKKGNENVQHMNSYQWYKLTRATTEDRENKIKEEDSALRRLESVKKELEIQIKGINQ